MSDHVTSVMEQWRRERPDLDTSPQAVIGRLHRIALRLTGELTEVYERFGLGEGEFDILAALRRQGAPYSLNPTDLAAQTMVTSGAITKRVARCIAHGWVTSDRSDHDGRGRLVTLTPAGRRLIDEAFTAHMANEARLLSRFSKQERDDLARLLEEWATDLGL